MEEKQTNVNVVLHMYRDAACRACNLMVLCSNDSDLEPALAMIHADLPDIRIGLVLPRSAENRGARSCVRLERHAHWTQRSIHAEELADSQLPDRLRDHWNRTINREEPLSQRRTERSAIQEVSMKTSFVNQSLKNTGSR